MVPEDAGSKDLFPTTFTGSQRMLSCHDCFRSCIFAEIQFGWLLRIKILSDVSCNVTSCSIRESKDFKQEHDLFLNCRELPEALSYLVWTQQVTYKTRTHLRSMLRYMLYRKPGDFYAQIITTINWANGLCKNEEFIKLNSWNY